MPLTLLATDWIRSKIKVLADSIPAEGPLLGLQMAPTHVSLSGGDRVYSPFLSLGLSSHEDGATLMTSYKPSNVPKHPASSTWEVGISSLNKPQPKTGLQQFCHLVSGRHYSAVARVTVSLPAPAPDYNQCLSGDSHTGRFLPSSPSFTESKSSGSL